MIEIATGEAVSKAPPSAFFARWIDHDSWAQWSPDTEWVKLNGPAQKGTTGVIKPKGGPKTKFVISTCERDREYTDTSTLPGARLVLQHTASVEGDKTKLNVRVTLDGVLARVWAKLIGKGFRESAQADLDWLVNLAES